MRFLFVLLSATLSAATALPVVAAETGHDRLAPVNAGAPVGATADAGQDRLDILFAELKRESNERAAERIANRILEEWSRSGSASIDLMMGWSKAAADTEKFDVALDFLDQITTMKPSYAEGWYRRATVHFMMNNHAKSLADINRTLQLEPRHFGALSGMGQIMKGNGRDKFALQAWQRVLDIYPMMRDAQNEMATLSEELADQGI